MGGDILQQDSGATQVQVFLYLIIFLNSNNFISNNTLKPVSNKQTGKNIAIVIPDLHP